jgi:LysR family hydrogen peroxide-inducible transcriptional activator
MMIVTMISLKQITYALAVADTLHFKKASEQCFISQSALSTAIVEMEKRLGFQLFERDNKKVFITPVGKEFLARAKQIKVQINDLYRLGESLKEPLSYPLSLGVIPTIGPYLIPKVLPEIRKQYPNLQLRIVEEQSHVLVDMVKNAEIDTAILALPYDIKGLLAYEFWQEDFFWITHKKNLPMPKEEVSSQELKDSHLMLLREGHCLKDHVLSACKMQSHESNVSLESTSLNMLVHMVSARMGTTLIPEIAIDQLLQGNPELKAIHLHEPGPHRRLAFIARPNYTGISNIELLKQVIIQRLSSGIVDLAS